MKHRLIRAALSLYPSAWRQRYGGELEDLLFDCGADAGSFLDTARLLIDLTGSGLTQRFRGYGAIARIAAIACFCAVAGIAVDASALTATDAPQMPFTPVSMVWLAPNAFLPPKVYRTHAPAWEFPRTRQEQPGRITIQFAPGTSRVVGISGPPTDIVLNPKTHQIISIRPQG